VTHIASIVARIISLALLGGGVALVDSQDVIILSGNPFFRVSVGIASIFCGAALGVLSLRKLYGHGKFSN
jgi:hypothetical protein